MHDPRVGRFFAVDPLTHKYSWNSPYAFSCNRVIDGVELEGKEFLDKDEALVELRNGIVYLKIENLSGLSRNAINQAHREAKITTTSDGNQVIGYDSQVVGKFTFSTFSLPDSGFDNYLADFGSRAEGADAKRSNEIFTIRIPTGFNKAGEESKRSIKRNYRLNDLSAKPFSPSLRYASGAILTIALLGEIYKNYALFTDVFEEQKINEQATLIANDVMGAISLAIRTGKIPKSKINEKDISDIANVILFGGNGNEGKEIRKIGLEIYNELTSEGTDKQLSKKIFKILRDSKQDDSTNLTNEQKQSTKAQDNTKVDH